MSFQSHKFKCFSTVVRMSKLTIEYIQHKRTCPFSHTNSMPIVLTLRKLACSLEVPALVGL